MIEIRHLDLAIGKRRLVGDISVTIPRGEFVALLGPNGVGKTTFLRSLCGLHSVPTGRVYLDGEDLSVMSIHARAHKVAYLATDDLFDDALLVRDVIASGRYAHRVWWRWDESPDDRAAIEAAMDAVRMTPFAGRRFTTLSSGERQRVWIAMALAQEAPILLLDEPTGHLDVRVADAILTLLRERSRAGTTILCAIHDLNEAAAFADRMLLFGCERMLTCAPPDELLAGDHLQSAYGIAMQPIMLANGQLRVFPARKA